MKRTAKGESIEFDFAKSMLCKTQTFYLDEIGKARSLSSMHCFFYQWSITLQKPVNNWLLAGH